MGEIKKQSVNNSIISYFGAALGMLLTFLQPYLISAADIGLLRLMYSFSWMTAVIMPLGVGSITLRYFPKIRNSDNGHHGLFALIFLLASLGAFIVATCLLLNKDFFIASFSKSPEFPKYFTEAVVLAYILSLISVYTVYSASLYKTTFTVLLTDVFTRVGQLILVVLYSYKFIDQKALIYLYLSMFLLQLLLMMWHLYKAKAIHFSINVAFFKTLPLKEIAAFGALMMVTAFASLGIKFIDQLMIGHFLSAQMVGIYATCAMMSVILEIPFNSLERIASPKIASAWNLGNTAEVFKVYELSSRYMFFAGAVLFCFLWAGIDFILELLPAQYALGRTAFYFVTASSLLNLLTGVNSSVIMYSHKYFAASAFLMVLIVVGLAANYFLIPLYGITGAAIATLIAIGTFNILKFAYIWYRFKMQPFSKFSLHIVLGTFVSLIPIVFWPQGTSSFVKALVGGGFTLLVFSLINIKFEIVEEVNKVFKRIGLIKN